MEISEILAAVFGVLVAILGFLVKSIYSDIKKSKQDLEELKIKSSNHERDQSHATHIENLKFKQINDHLKAIRDEIRELKDEFGYLRRRRDERGRYIKTERNE